MPLFTTIAWDPAFAYGSDRKPFIGMKAATIRTATPAHSLPILAALARKSSSFFSAVSEQNSKKSQHSNGKRQTITCQHSTLMVVFPLPRNTKASNHMAKPDKNVANETHIANMLLVPIGEVWADWSKNPRGRGVLPSKDDPTSFDFLRENILSTGGLLQPPLAIREDGPNGEKYRVIAGYRRFEVVSTLATVAEHAAKFSHIPLTVRDGVCVDLGSSEDPTAEDAAPTFKRHEVGGRLGELLLAASENSARQDVSVWDRAAMAVAFESEGLTTKEACAILGERGTSLSANQVRIYQKLGSLGVKLRKRLEKLGGAGYKLGTEIITAEFNQQAFPKIKWDVEKQTAHVDAYLEKIAEEAKEKEAGGGKKKGKAPRYVVKAGELDARYRDIAEVASQDVIVTIDFLLGKATRADVVAATDEAFASALSGEGPDGPEKSGATPEWEDALPFPFQRKTPHAATWGVFSCLSRNATA